jgi:DNA-binding transcriptional MerR regulator/methylmalonyl-CoA mutase cobalamin-binding subunit
MTHTASAASIPIRTLAALTGVNAITLRAWERRYGLLKPQRTPSGHRLYSHQHVELVRRVQALIARGVPVSRVPQALGESEPERAERAGSGAWPGWRSRMAAAIARFDEPALEEVYDEALALHPVERVTRLLLMPLLAELGRRWQRVAGAVAEEHFFAVYLRNKIGARFHHRRRLEAGPRLLAACAPGEQHEIGLLLFCLAAHDAGMRPVPLGADMPLEEIAAAVRPSGCAAVVLSSSQDPRPETLARALPQLVRAAGAPVFVGGRTAERHRGPILAAGAIPLGTDIQAGLRMIATSLAGGGGKR